MNTNKDVIYLNKVFQQWKDNLINFTKVYYPNTFSDFSEASPNMLLIDLSAYVGDSLSFYIDKQLQESLLLHAQEKKNLLSLARAFGYKPKLSIPAICTVDFFQLVPASGSGNNVTPDLRYALSIKPNTIVKSTAGNINFITQQYVDFNTNSLKDPLNVTVYSINQTTGYPDYYLLRKSTDIIAAEIRTTNVNVEGPEQFYTTIINDDNIVDILDVYDSDGNQWYEVPYLAQDSIFTDELNTSNVDPSLAQYNTIVPYLLRLKKIPRRFVTRITADEKVELQFGAGISDSPDEVLIPNPDNIGSPLLNGRTDLQTTYARSNYIYTRTYGQIPTNTTLTIRYLVGGGIKTNVPANTITEITSLELDSSRLPVSNQILNNQVLNSVAVINTEAASGGRDGETNEEIRQNALASIQSNQRCITKADYISKVYTMDSKYGSVAKAYIVQDEQLNLNDLASGIKNPLAMNLYCLGLNNDKQLTQLNPAVKRNLITYLNRYKAATDSINIKDGYIINIGCNFDIIPKIGFIDNEVLLNCVNTLKDFFDIDNWQINQPIVIGNVYEKLQKVPGVQNVVKVNIVNKFDTDQGYSPIYYDINAATRRGIVYPSIDPSIFEVKFLDRDINGRITTY